MKNSKFHRLLNRQLKKAGLENTHSEEMSQFLELVNDAYKNFDKDILRIENILEESSKELFVANKNLEKERDVTQQKLENIVDNVKGVIFETDLAGNFTYLNKAWKKYTGISIKNSLGKNFKDFLKIKNQKLSGIISENIRQKKKSFKTIFDFQLENDENVWVELKFVLVTDKSGNETGFIGSIVDVTSLKETEINLQKANEAKDNFLSTMSHEIRTPLNAVTGMTNILLMEDHLPQQLENLKALKYSGEHLLGLINDLLDFNKIQAGEMKVIENEFNLEGLLDDIKNNFKLKAREKNLNFQVFLDKDIPPQIIGDKLKLTQILNNLVSNALKFTDSGSIILNVSNLERDTNKVTLEFKLKDTGIGISKDKQRSIFESFIQEDQDTYIKYGGTGLGLAISGKLLELQNSHLDLLSEPGKGALFSFEIKYKVSNDLNAFNPETVKSKQDYEPLHLDVLIAEDNKINVLILKRFFSKWKVNYKVAENGIEATEIFKNANFDLILMDIQMPKRNGYEATDIIRALPDADKRDVPIIALTAFAQTDIKEKTIQYKMNGFLGKPFNPCELYNLLKNIKEKKAHFKAEQSH